MERFTTHKNKKRINILKQYQWQSMNWVQMPIPPSYWIFWNIFTFFAHTFISLCKNGCALTLFHLKRVKLHYEESLNWNNQFAAIPILHNTHQLAWLWWFAFLTKFAALNLTSSQHECAKYLKLQLYTHCFCKPLPGFCVFAYCALYLGNRMPSWIYQIQHSCSGPLLMLWLEQVVPSVKRATMIKMAQFFFNPRGLLASQRHS